MADTRNQSYIESDVYVNYTADNVPCSQGNLIDVTSQLADDTTGHVHDLYGNVLTLNTANGSVTDAGGQVVGFIYHAVVGP